MSSRFNLPKVLTVELTYRCNHKCLFCSCPWENQPRLKEKELSAKEWKEIFKKVKEYGVKQITFSGGEAILREDLFEILDGAYDFGFSLGLISNGKNIDDVFLRSIKKYNRIKSSKRTR